MDYTVIDTLRELIEERGLTLREVSENTGIPYITIKRFFSGAQDLSYSKFVRLLEEFDIRMDELIAREVRGLRYIGNRPRHYVLREIGDLLMVIKPYRIKGLIRSILNHAEKTRGVDKDLVRDLRQEYFYN